MAASQMIAQYWKFASQRMAILALIQAELIANDSDLEPKKGTIVWVGRIYYGGKFDHQASRLIEPPTAFKGYHVNYLGPYVESLEQYRVFPEEPSFTFA
ncbi:MAG: hypothetical protein EBZ05_03480 [Verrucomicrobia bacterium]|nr:hypothetical protein [Verrucomicrobiota bacterium]